MGNVTKTDAFATGFAAAFSVSGLEGSGMSAAAMWRPTAAAGSAARHTQIKQYVVTTRNAGRGNKGTSPWGFPV